MRKSYSKIRHIQEANKRLEERIIQESLKSVITEAVLPNIQEGDDLCDILCKRKQAKFGANGSVVQLIQNALAKCGFNVEKEGGGINKGCKDDAKNCDGKFRKETAKAVKEFQRAMGLAQDGSVGYKTLTALGSQAASSVGGCIDLPECNCNKKPKDKDKENREDWWTLIDGGNSSMDDCDTINKCLYKAINNCKGPVNDTSCFSNTFFKCMREGGPKKGGPKKGGNKKCGDCPDYINRMPGPGQKPLSDFEQGCIQSGCSKVAQ